MSVDSRFTLRAWAEKIKLTFPLLSDFPHRKVAQAYGVYSTNRGASRRVTFLIDKEGIIRHKVVSPFNRPRDHRETLQALGAVQ